MRVGFIGGKWLGIKCLEVLCRDNRFDVVAVSVPPRDRNVWWDDVVDEDEVERLGFSNTTPEDVLYQNLDLVFSVLTGHIFTSNDLLKFSIINLHPAPLPYYRGCNSYAHAIMNKEPYYGVSLHYIDEGIDTGPVIDVDWMPIYDDDTGKSLYHRAQPIALTMFKRNLSGIYDAHSWGSRTATTTQDDSQAKYYKRDSLQEHMSIHYTDEEADRKIRALTFPPHPLPKLILPKLEGAAHDNQR